MPQTRLLGYVYFVILNVPVMFVMIPSWCFMTIYVNLALFEG